MLEEKGLRLSLRQMLACSDDVFSARIARGEQTDEMTSHVQDNPDLAEDQHSTPFCEPNKGIGTDS